MQWTRRWTEVALLGAALALGVGQARAQERHPTGTTAKGKRVTHADRKAVALRRAELQRRAEAERKAASEPSPTRANRGGSQ
jgi:hypothetical protein